jgi:hypothetical protein
MVVENDILIPQFADYLRENKEVLFTPSGVSMRPFIEGGKDSVILQPVTDEPKVGDVILAEVNTPYKGKTYVLHRLIRIEKDEQGAVYVLQGDGNLTGEEVCRRVDIIGRVTAVQMPSGRRKCLTKGRLWHRLFPVRKWLLKIYRHTLLKMYK